MKKLKMIVGIDKGELIKSNKRIVACGKNFETILNSSFGIKSVVVEMCK